MEGQIISFKTDKSVYEITYNRSTGTLTGDTLITVLDGVTDQGFIFSYGFKTFWYFFPNTSTKFEDLLFTQDISEVIISENSATPIGTNPKYPYLGNYTQIVSVCHRDEQGNYNEIGQFTIKINFTTSSIIPSTDELSTTEVNFCLEQKKIQFTKALSNAIGVKVIVNASITYADETKTFQNTYFIPYFKNSASVDIGYKIQQLFRKSNKNLLSVENTSGVFAPQLLYKPAQVQTLIYEVDKFYENITPVLEKNYRFYAGKRPKAYPIFSNHLSRHRVNGGKYLFSYIAGKVFASQLSDNINTELPTTTDDVVCVLLEDSKNAISWKKKKQIPVHTGSIDIYTFPKPSHIIHVQWMNENITSEWFPFTGNYKISADFNHSISKNVFNGLNKKFDSEKVRTLSVNTGFILKDEIEVISEIIQSKECFFEIDGKIYHAFCKTEKMPELDNTREFYEYDLEFLIVE